MFPPLLLGYVSKKDVIVIVIVKWVYVQMIHYCIRKIYCLIQPDLKKLICCCIFANTDVLMNL